MCEHEANPAVNEANVARRRRLDEIAVPRPRCPMCKGAHLAKYRSISDQGDGSALWWVKCRNEKCAHRFRVLLE